MNNSLDWSSYAATVLEFLRTDGAGLLATLLIIYLIQRLVVFLAYKYVSDEGRKLEFRKWSRYVALWFAVVWVLITYGMHRQKDVFFLIGIFLAFAALSLRDLFSNFVGWLVVMTSRTYRQGDRIRIAQVSGDVVDIGIFRTVVAEIGEWVDADQSTGRLVMLPNNMVLSNPVYNYTQGHDFIWNEFCVLVTFASDWQKAEQIMLDVVQRDFAEKEEQIRERFRRARKQYYVTYTFITPKVYVSIADSGIRLTSRYLVRARRRRTLDDSVSRVILDKFSREPKIDFAYPSLSVYREPADKPPSGSSC